MEVDIYGIIEHHTGKSIKDFSKKELEELVAKYEKMKYDYGEAIGVVAAQSIAEPATQTTLRSYHAAGRVQLVTTKGLPRLIELFDARAEPKTPSMTIYMDKDHNDVENAKKLAASIKETSLKQIIIEDSINLVDKAVEIVLDEAEMKELDLTIDNVVNNIKKTTKGVVINVDKNVLKVIPQKDKEVDVRELQQLRVKLRNKYLKGLKEIKQVLIEKDRDSWVIKTIGSNLRKILSYPGVDKTRTITNDVFEISRILGIEAARSAIINETLETMREQGVDTDERHVLLVADTMTFEGVIKPIGRYGIAGGKSSVLARANFEETVKHLSSAGLKGELDPLSSVVENVIIGNVAPIGTGMIKVRFKD